jgi:hypothetical protein
VVDAARTPPHVVVPPISFHPGGFCITPLRSIADRARDAYRVDYRLELGLRDLVRQLILGDYQFGNAARGIMDVPPE